MVIIRLQHLGAPVGPDLVPGMHYPPDGPDHRRILSPRPHRGARVGPTLGPNPESVDWPNIPNRGLGSRPVRLKKDAGRHIRLPSVVGPLARGVAIVCEVHRGCRRVDRRLVQSGRAALVGSWARIWLSSRRRRGPACGHLETLGPKQQKTLGYSFRFRHGGTPDTPPRGLVYGW